ncbi:hypothetical protein BDR06DRAFT_1055459 [Suillus hirtellus]|nr:hypothetical protein BDR06DRAFT_1055459 [Suillus hirtellus]
MTTEHSTPSILSKRAISSSDPLISHGRHFGQTVFALCNYPSLLTNGILRLEQMEETPLEDFSAEERREHHVFEQLLDSYPGLLDRLRNGSEEEILHVGELIGKGASGARGDNTKSLKSAILDWISPKGASIQPPLHRNSKIDRGFNHELTGLLLCPTGSDWHDAESRLLTCVSMYTFTLVDKDPKATRSGNARLHGMNCVTIASIAYIATQVRFALSSSSVFSRTDTSTDSETFYHSLLDLFEDPDKSKEVDELLTWWNRQVFPTSSAAKRPISVNSALAKIRIKRLATKNAADSNITVASI